MKVGAMGKRRRRGEVVTYSLADLAELTGQSLAGSGFEDEAEAIRVGFRHQGNVEYQRAMRRVRRLWLAEQRRLAGERKALLEAGGCPEDAPQLFPGTPLVDRAGEPLLDMEGKPVKSRPLQEGDARTPEGEEELRDAMRATLLDVDEATGRALIAKVEGLEVDPDAPPDELVAELERVGILELAFAAALEVQSPAPQFRSARAGAGVAGPE